MKLQKLLESELILTIKNWYDIYCLSDQYLIYQPKSTAKGCAFIKIGKMLQELGVLPPREDEFERQVQNQLSYFSEPENYELFVESLIKINTSKETVRHYLMALKDYSFWLFHTKKYSIEIATINDFESYLRTLKVRHTRDCYNYINRYYKWAVLKGFADSNPISKVVVNRVKGKVSILDDSVVRQLLSFIRSHDSDPEQAVMIALVLIWGLKTCDLAHATILIDGDSFQVKLRRKQLTKGRAYYNRDEIISFPRELIWCKQLQKNFIGIWINKYNHVKKTYPNTPLLLHKRSLTNNFLSTNTINQRFQDATFEATGIKIPANIVKQTCGHLHSQSGEASALTRLGWSAQFAFHYTWLPREIWTK
ncbi:MAG: hypothetical protein ACJAVA_002593 [Flavobacteriaceae bacterium]|jgi:hypothetical protein